MVKLGRAKSAEPVSFTESTSGYVASVLLL